MTTPSGSIFDRARLRFIGAMTWAVVAVPFVITVVRDPGSVRVGATRVGLIGIAVFLAAFLVGTRRGSRRRLGMAMLGVQAFAAAAAAVFVFGGVFAPGGILTVVVAGQLAVWAPRRGWWWILGQTALLWIAYRLASWPLGTATLIAAAFGAFQCFAFSASLVAEREAAGRRRLAELNARLMEAQRQLAVAAASNERARIWRELHDVTGHHLAALTLNLEAASNLTSGRGQELVRHCRALARLMLADIRSVLSEPAAAAPLGSHDLAEQLAALGRDLPGIAVRVEVGLLDPEPSAAAAHALLRAAQECITNATIHGQARNIHIVCRVEDGAYVLDVRDDGRGASSITPGSGLSHMRDRFERLGGHVRWTSQPGAGLRLLAAIPVAVRAVPGTLATGSEDAA